MRVFVTGAAGFIGSNLVPQLLGAGHQVTGLCRSNEAAAGLEKQGAVAAIGDINDAERLRGFIESADAVVHTAFRHDFADLKKSSEEDRTVIHTIGDVLAGSPRPFLVTSGTGLVRPSAGKPAIETDPHVSSTNFPRAATEEAADDLLERGLDVRVIRLSQVHNLHKQGRISLHVDLAKKKGWVAYVDAGDNGVPAVHVTDAARLFELALDRGQTQTHYHAVAEEGIPMRSIAEAIGYALSLPTRSISRAEAADYFGPIAGLVSVDLSASAAMTREQLGWNPVGLGLIADLNNLEG